MKHHRRNTSTTGVRWALGLGVLLAFMDGCQWFTTATGEPDALDGGVAGHTEGVGPAAGGGSTAPGAGGGCSASDCVAPCASCEEGQCVAAPVGTVCGAGVCDGARGCAVGDLAWVRTFGQPARGTVGQDIDVDANGAVLVTGYYVGSSSTSLAFDEHEVGLSSVDGDANIFALAIDAADGTVSWADDIGAGADNSGQFSESLVADRVRGGAWLGGHFAGSFEFGAWSTMTNNAGNDALIGRIGTDGGGEQSWTFHDAKTQEVWSLAADETGRIVAAGVNSGRIQAAATEHESTNARETAFAMLLEADGSPAWVNGLAHVGADTSEGHAVAITNHAVWAGGAYRGSASEAGGPGDALPPSGASQSIFLARYALADGAFVRLDGWGSATADQAIGGMAGTGDEVVVAGTHSGPFAFGTALVENAGMFVVWLDSSGAVALARSFAATMPLTVHDVAVDERGNVLVVGSTHEAGTLAFDSHALELPGKGAFVVKIAHGGEVLWAHATPGSFDALRGVSARGDAVFVVGFTTGGAFGEPAAVGPYDLLVARLSP